MTENSRDRDSVYIGYSLFNRVDSLKCSQEMIRTYFKQRSYTLGVYYNGEHEPPYDGYVEDHLIKGQPKEKQNGSRDAANVLYANALETNCRWFIYTNANTVFFSESWITTCIREMEEQGKVLGTYGAPYPTAGTGYPFCTEVVFFDLESPVFEQLFPIPAWEEPDVEGHEPWVNPIYEEYFMMSFYKAVLESVDGRSYNSFYDAFDEIQHNRNLKRFEDDFIYRLPGMELWNQERDLYTDPGNTYHWEEMDRTSRRWEHMGVGVWHGHDPERLKKHFIDRGFPGTSAPPTIMKLVGESDLDWFDKGSNKF